MIFSRYINCSRCGETHFNIEMIELADKVTEYTHFAWCPKKNEPVLINLIKLEELKEEVKLDSSYYNEFLDRAYLMGDIIETISNHPVKLQNNEVEKQVDKIAMECAELYQLVGNFEETWKEEVLSDIKNKLMPITMLVDLIEGNKVLDELVDDAIGGLAENVRENIKYLSNIKL